MEKQKEWKRGQERQGEWWIQTDPVRCHYTHDVGVMGRLGRWHVFPCLWIELQRASGVDRTVRRKAVGMEWGGVGWEAEGLGHSRVFSWHLCVCLLQREQTSRPGPPVAAHSFPPVCRSARRPPYQVIASEPYLLLQNLGPGGVPAGKLRQKLPSKSQTWPAATAAEQEAQWEKRPWFVPGWLFNTWRVVFFVAGRVLPAT